MAFSAPQRAGLYTVAIQKRNRGSISEKERIEKEVSSQELLEVGARIGNGAWNSERYGGINRQ